MHEFRLGREAMDNPMRLVFALMDAVNHSLPEESVDEGRVTLVPTGGFDCQGEARAGPAGAQGGGFPAITPSGLATAWGDVCSCRWGYRRYFDVGLRQEQWLAMLWGVPPADGQGSPLPRKSPRSPDPSREALSFLAPLLARFVCKSYALLETLARSRQLVDALSLHSKIGSIVVKSPSEELMCSQGAKELLDEWFPPQEREPNGLPKEWQERLRTLEQPPKDGEHEQLSWKRNGDSQGLRVNFVPLSGQRPHRSWVLLLEKVPLSLPMPQVWRDELTPREAEVVECALQYMDNREIGDHLACTEATVKKHLQRAFEKLGVENRNMLFYWAIRR